MHLQICIFNIEADPKTELEVNLPEQIITLKQLEKRIFYSPVTKE
jgi:hypothetical protein